MLFARRIRPKHCVWHPFVISFSSGLDGGTKVAVDLVRKLVAAFNENAVTIRMGAGGRKSVADDVVFSAVRDVNGVEPGGPLIAADEFVGRNQVTVGHVFFPGVIKALNVDVVVRIVTKLVADNDLLVGLQS